MVQPFNFGNGQVISSHPLPGSDYLFMLGLKLNHGSESGPRNCNRIQNYPHILVAVERRSNIPVTHTKTLFYIQVSNQPYFRDKQLQIFRTKSGMTEGSYNHILYILYKNVATYEIIWKVFINYVSLAYISSLSLRYEHWWKQLVFLIHAVYWSIISRTASHVFSS